MILKKCYKLFGVAGAGKTTKCCILINYFIKELGYSLEDITFTTFTKAGIAAIKKKLYQFELYLPNNQNHYFRTLNSLTWKILELNEQDAALKPSERNNFFKDIGIKTEPDENDKIEMDTITEIYDKILNNFGKYIPECNKIDLKGYIKNYCNEMNIEMESEIILNSLFAYHNWKKEKNKYDYVDSIIETLKQEKDIPTKILIVDEAQDLSYAQICLVKMWIEKYDKDFFIISGDDDQTVHEWTGASPNFLIDFKSNNMEEIVLEYSYRLPKIVANFCNEILKTIKVRKVKFIKSDIEDGKIKTLTEFDWKFPITFEKNHNIDGGQTYLLFRTNKIKMEIAELLFNYTNIPFNFISDKRIMQSKWSEKFVKVCNALNKIDKNEELLTEEAKSLFDVLCSKDEEDGVIIKRSGKAWIKNYKEETISTKKLLEWTMWNSQTTIHDALVKKERNYKNSIIKYINWKNQKSKNADKINLDYKNKLLQIDKIIPIDKDGYINYSVSLGTYHSSKGLDAENIYVFLGTANFFRDINDAERRCFYTACSRTKKNLYLIKCMHEEQKTYLQEEFETLIDKYI